MGSNTSKQDSDAAVQTEHTQKSSDLDSDGNSDPRSPTSEIVRTPLQGKTGLKHNITKNADLRKTFENSNGDERLIHNNPILSAVIKNHLQSYDPRSPTQDFERTPIIITSKIDDIAIDKRNLRMQSNNNSGSPCLKMENQDENYDSCVEAQESPEAIVPKNLCNGFFDMTLNDTMKEIDEPLGSSTASNEAIENNISNESATKPTQLLETNFDYVETTEKYNEESKLKSFEDKDSSPQAALKVPLLKILADDPRSPSTGIERTPIVVSRVLEDTSEDNVEEMSDDTLIKVLQNTNTELRQTAVKPINDGVLIYEDESNNMLDTPKKSKSDCSSGSRTPLSCMKNKTDAGHMRSKSANMLEDTKGQKLPAKLSKRASHIPRLKSLSKQTKMFQTASSVSLKNINKPTTISGDCENTPPHSHRDKWDKDNSIVL